MHDQQRAFPIPQAVAAVFVGFPKPARLQLLAIRRLIFEVAERTPNVGPLVETLKWSEPAYLTAASRGGSTIRLGMLESHADTAAILFNCRTALVESFRARFPDSFDFHGNRAILVPPSVPLPEPALAICLAMALTYHRRAEHVASWPEIDR